MSLTKTPDEIDKLRHGGRILSDILAEIASMAKPGMTTGELDVHAERRMREQGGTPSFKGYRSSRDQTPFPSVVCMSINHEIVHAPAFPSRTLKDGDLLKLDIGMWHEGLCTDMAVTVPVGNVPEEQLHLARTTRESLFEGIAKVQEGGWIGDIGKAVDKYVRRQGFSTVKALVGHGVGHAVHEDPQVPNYFDPSMRPIRIVRGMVLALEPMVNVGDDDVESLVDGWTIVTADGSRSAHFEATVAVTEDGTEILTPIPETLLPT